jgi:hypothetical protein
MADKNGLLGIIGTVVLVSAMSVGLIRSCQDNYDKSRPGVVYLVKGKPVIERRFNTNEELKRYEESEQGKREVEYYLAQNKRNNKVK